MGKIIIEFTDSESKLLLEALESGYEMDKGDPEEAPENAERDWKSMISKFKKEKQNGN